MKNKIVAFISLILISTQIYAAQETSSSSSSSGSGSNIKRINIPDQYIQEVQEGQEIKPETLDVNNTEAFTATEFKELIKDKTAYDPENPDKALMPYTLARVVTVDEAGKQYVHYYDAEMINQFLFPNKEAQNNTFKTDLELRQHLIRKKDIQTRLPIQDVQYFIVNNIDEPVFRYHGNISEYAVRPQAQEGTEGQQASGSSALAAQPAQPDEIDDLQHRLNFRDRIRIRPLEIAENNRYILDFHNYRVIDRDKNSIINFINQDKILNEKNFLDKIMNKKNYSLLNDYSLDKYNFLDKDIQFNPYKNIKLDLDNTSILNDCYNKNSYLRPYDSKETIVDSMLLKELYSLLNRREYLSPEQIRIIQEKIREFLENL